MRSTVPYASYGYDMLLILPIYSVTFGYKYNRSVNTHTALSASISPSSAISRYGLIHVAFSTINSSYEKHLGQKVRVVIISYYDISCLSAVHMSISLYLGYAKLCL